MFKDPSLERKTTDTDPDLESGDEEEGQWTEIREKEGKSL